jgi:streptogramin lyase
MRAGRPIVLTAFGTLMICAASLAFLVAANAQAPASSQPSIETGWKEISHGESWHGVQFDTQGGVWFHAGASSIKIASLEPYYQTVAVSPNGPKGRFAIVVGYGNEERPG